MSLRSLFGKSSSSDEKIIQAHTQLIEADATEATNLMSAANQSAASAREFEKEFPTVPIKKQVNDVAVKVTDMKTCFDKLVTARKEAAIAAANSDKGTVVSKATDVSNRLDDLKKLEVSRSSLFETVETAVEKERPFKAVVDEIKGIQTDIQGLLRTARNKATAAEDALNKARKLPVDLSGHAKVAANKAQSLTPTVREVATAANDAKNVVTTIDNQLTIVKTALTNADAAATSKNKAGADAALESAKEAKRKADRAAGVKETGTSEATTASTGHGKTDSEKESSVEQLQSKLWGRLLILFVSFFAIVLFVHDDALKLLFGAAWTVMLVLSVIPRIGKHPQWGKVVWAFVGVILLYLAFHYITPVFTGGESVTDAAKSAVGIETEPSPTATVAPTAVPDCGADDDAWKWCDPTPQATST